MARKCEFPQQGQLLTRSLSKTAERAHVSQCLGLEIKTYRLLRIYSLMLHKGVISFRGR